MLLAGRQQKRRASNLRKDLAPTILKQFAFGYSALTLDKLLKS